LPEKQGKGKGENTGWAVKWGHRVNAAGVRSDEIPTWQTEILKGKNENSDREEEGVKEITEYRGA